MAEVIVACVDGSRRDAPVVLEASRLAWSLGAPRIIVLHVVDTRGLPAPPDTAEGRAFLDELRLRGLEALERARTLAAEAGVEAIAVAREGDPCREIVGFARDARAWAVVVGSEPGELPSTVRCVLTHWRGGLLAARAHPRHARH